VYLAELAEAAGTAKGRMEELATARYHNECSAVAAAVGVVRRAAVAETELPHDLLLVRTALSDSPKISPITGQRTPLPFSSVFNTETHSHMRRCGRWARISWRTWVC